MQNNKMNLSKLKICLYTLMYCISSLSLGFFTSYFLSQKSYNFRFPLFKASIQNLVHFIAATILLKYKNEKSEESVYSGATIPCALTAAVDIGLSSYSLRIVSLAFYTMVKSSAPVFILLSGFIFGIETPSITFFLIIFTIGTGVFLTSINGKSFDTTGFTIISFASFMAGFRWAFVQYLIEKRDVKQTSIYFTIRDLCLPISVALCLFSMKIEGIRDIATSEFFNTWNAVLKNLGIIASSGLLSFMLLCSEFLVVSETSVVFLSVSGIIKELVIILFSVLRKDIELSFVNYVGLVISIVGILCYNFTRKLQAIEILE